MEPGREVLGPRQSRLLRWMYENRYGGYGHRGYFSQYQLDNAALVDLSLKKLVRMGNAETLGPLARHMMVPHWRISSLGQTVVRGNHRQWVLDEECDDMATLQKDDVLAALREVGGNYRAAGELLGVTDGGVRWFVKRHGLKAEVDAIRQAADGGSQNGTEPDRGHPWRRYPNPPQEKAVARNDDRPKKKSTAKGGRLKDGLGDPAALAEELRETRRVLWEMAIEISREEAPGVARLLERVERIDTVLRGEGERE